jgi:CHASE2 domain-containing sensor protein
MPVAQILKAVLISVVLTLFAFVGGKLNLFGFEDVMDAASDDVFQQITSGTYGDRPEEREGQDRIRIISIDETGIEALRQGGWNGWPPGLDSLGILIEDMAYGSEPGPRAIFLDLIITGASTDVPSVDLEAILDSELEATPAVLLLRSIAEVTQARAWSGQSACRTDPLIRLACIIEAGGTPVILARPDALEQNGLTELQRQLDNVALLTPVLVNVRNYPLVDDYAQGPLPGVYGFDLYPASALYAADCLHDILRNGQARACDGQPVFQQAAEAARAALRPGARSSVPGTQARDIWSTPVAVLWGSRQPDRQTELTARVSSGIVPECEDRMGVVERSLRSLFNALPQSTACAYTFNLGYDRIVAGFGLEQDDYRYIFEDRLILVGSHMLNSDWVPTPVHGQLPGVHYHAMALDNLVSLDSRYRRADTTWFSTDDLFQVILTFILLLAVILAVMGRNTLLEDFRPQWKSRPPLWATVAYYASLIVLVVGLTWLIALIGKSAWDQAVINWLGIMGLAFGVLFMAARLTFITDVGGPLAFVDTWTRKLEFGDRNLTRRRRPDETPQDSGVPPPPKRQRRTPSSNATPPGTRRPRSRRKQPDASS